LISTWPGPKRGSDGQFTSDGKSPGLTVGNDHWVDCPLICTFAGGYIMGYVEDRSSNPMNMENMGIYYIEHI
jgi:hypothetical protein